MTEARFPRVALVTRTLWNEPPRLRHQVARLLAERGHQVTFFERPGLHPTAPGHTTEGIALRGLPELIHHQLRWIHPLTLVNAAWMHRGLARAFADVRPDLVINFNYDYYPLRDALPDTPIITLINDDFVNRARPLARREARWAYGRTLRASDRTLAVSYPLVRQALAITPGVELFLPWARSPYRAPRTGGDRRATLYWGYINDRLDWTVIRGLLDGGQLIHFAGPVHGTTRAASVLDHPNARYHGVAELASLESVIAECNSSILPYDLSRSHLEVTISNRAFELLSWGLPLVYADYPELLEAPPGVFRRARTVEDFARGISAARQGFGEIQQAIVRFLDQHTPDRRYAQLMKVAHGAAK